MLTLFFFIVFIASFIIMVFFIISRIPVLAELPFEEKENKERLFLNNLKDRIKGNGWFKNFSLEMILHRILSKIRILTLKVENKTGCYLIKLRQKTIEKKKSFQEDYWDKLKIKKRSRKNKKSDE
ncbi:MAG: hypothetical protein PHI53_00820 [Candidatus Pacebacteria bacterium]|nr:hypothetical protein [Candidatus Paceibacterota bacterium]